jgi:hypothetical protein
LGDLLVHPQYHRRQRGAYEDGFSEENAHAVRRLRAAGAIILGKTNLQESLTQKWYRQPARFGMRLIKGLNVRDTKRV